MEGWKKKSLVGGCVLAKGAFRMICILWWDFQAAESRTMECMRAGLKAMLACYVLKKVCSDLT